MNSHTTAGRLVIVPAALLDDMLELARLGIERLDITDPLRPALQGSIAAIRTAGIVEPT